MVFLDVDRDVQEREHGGVVGAARGLGGEVRTEPKPLAVRAWDAHLAHPTARGAARYTGWRVSLNLVRPAGCFDHTAKTAAAAALRRRGGGAPGGGGARAGGESVGGGAAALGQGENRSGGGGAQAAGWRRTGAEWRRRSGWGWRRTGGRRGGGCAEAKHRKC
ncbi:hypothetical protein BRADI_5g27421v3 [Brachypodium distachyon]|uniref:Uncharacterized protein n=1 Tax=Brachypodium distachyon TaxID=15368 RepID=A0A2K2CJL4_BRADI|nr:hypothetical protein BRADI_5g27421v3 [Brachypodium distachyon]